jgi:hypothetical protein
MMPKVHLDDKSCKYIDGAKPYTEMLYVLDHSSDAEILTVIKDHVSAEKFRKSVNDSNLKKTYALL